MNFWNAKVQVRKSATMELNAWTSLHFENMGKNKQIIGNCQIALLWYFLMAQKEVNATVNLHLFEKCLKCII